MVTAPPPNANVLWQRLEEALEPGAHIAGTTRQCSRNLLGFQVHAGGVTETRHLRRDSRSGSVQGTYQFRNIQAVNRDQPSCVFPCRREPVIPVSIDPDRVRGSHDPGMPRRRARLIGRGMAQ